MQNQPELIDQFPYNSDKQWFDAVQFVRKAPFAEDFWQTFKGLYKKAEQYVLASPTACTGMAQALIAAFLERIDAATTAEIAQQRFPTAATLGYMKRRARRLLNTLGKSHPDIYISLAKSLLMAQEGKEEIHSEQWICLDLFFAKSQRYKQNGFGHGNYQLDKSKFQLKKPEERFSALWEQQMQLLYNLLQKDMPALVCDFAVKILTRLQSGFPALSERALLRFFQSGSTWLQRVAVKMAYEKLTLQGISPELRAGLWFFSSPAMRKNVEAVVARTAKPSKDDENAFVDSLMQMAWGLLKAGSNGRRVIVAMEYIRARYPVKLKGLDTLALAPALLQSNHSVLQELALASAQNAKKEDAMAWLLALGDGEADTRRMKLYDQLKAALASKFATTLYRDDMRKFVFHTNFYVADFGWHLTSRMQQWQMHQFWSKFTTSQAVEGKRRAIFLHAISSQSGVKAFLRYVAYSDYVIGQFSPVCFQFIAEYGHDDISKAIKSYYKKQAEYYPVYYLPNLATLPIQWRDSVFETVLSEARGKPNFDYPWYIHSMFVATEANDWLLEASIKLLNVSKIDEQIAQNILDGLFGYDMNMAAKERIFEKLLTLTKDRQDILLKTLAKQVEILTRNAAILPDVWRARVLQNLDIGAVMEIARDAEQANWVLLQEAVYDFLRTNPQPAEFWRGILETAIAQPDSPLVARILQNEDCKRIFFSLKDTAILEISQPENEDLLVEWAQTNHAIFTMGSGELFRLCIHKLPKVRQFGYQHAHGLGLTNVFALRLMESGLPEAVGEAQCFFSGLPANSETEWEALLGMIDSPNRQVRIFALAYWKERAAHLGTRPQLLPFLSEHSDQAVQEAVAKEIKEKNVQNPFVQRFEKEVLRQKNKARKAKDIVKAHIEQTLDMDAKTLIEIAQSANKREAEWAIVQLTKKALAGEDTAGFVLQ